MGKKQTEEVRSRAKRKFWALHIKKCEKSGLSQIGYCKQHNLNKHTFGYWKTKINLENRIKPKSLLPVLITPDINHADTTSHSGISLRVQEQFILGFENQFNPDTLSRLIDLLEKR
ncbi:MAG: hypothetical protein GY786_16690 [Proteobacteria bacterium]|nr:hypothetical protein [Pseudomonadota bacterium]